MTANHPAENNAVHTAHIGAVANTYENALAAQAKAMVEARYIMAMRNPRNMRNVREQVLSESARPSFANGKSTLYSRKIGGQMIEGLGIRFVEMAVRAMSNVLIETIMVFEDDARELHRVTVTDLESNVTYPMDVRIDKTVERRYPADDGSYISFRKNSYGKNVYRVAATEDDLQNKRGALISKATRTLGLRVLPGDLCDEAEAIIRKTRQASIVNDPNAVANIIKSFAELEISERDLANFLQKQVKDATNDDVLLLRSIYSTVRDGEATWDSYVVKEPQHGEPSRTPETAAQYRASTPAPAPAPTPAPAAKPAQATLPVTAPAAAPVAAVPAGPADPAGFNLDEANAAAQMASHDANEYRDAQTHAPSPSVAATPAPAPAPVATTAKPANGKPLLTSSQFKQKAAAWKAQLNTGRSVDQLLAIIASRNTMTEQQEADVRSWAVSK